VLCTLALLPLTSLAEKKAITYVKNNRRSTIVGEVTKTDGGYDVKTEFGTIRLTNKEIVEIRDLAGEGNSFERRLKAIAPNDLDALADLATWAIEQEMYDEAESVIEKIQKVSPGHRRAALLEQRLKELQKQQNGTGPVRPQPRRPRVGPASREWLVSEEDVNTIRREELSGREDDLPITLRDNLARRFAQSWSGRDEFRDPDFTDRFYSWSPKRQAMFIMEKTQPGSSFRDDIVVLKDPKFMRDFASDVWPLVENSCASPSCHGGNRPRGGLMLIRGSQADPRVRYTNFVLLDGTRDKRSRRLINRDDPERSLLLEYLLTEDAQKYSHPRDISPVFKDRGDRRYRKIHDWVSRLQVYPTRPDYSKLDFRPPFNIKLQFRNPTARLLLGDKAFEDAMSGDEEDKPAGGS
jgi:hypothetical protein